MSSSSFAVDVFVDICCLFKDVESPAWYEQLLQQDENLYLVTIAFLLALLLLLCRCCSSWRALACGTCIGSVSCRSTS
jgi:hypothetical protein